MLDQSFLFKPQFDALSAAGLNLIAAFELSRLPSDLNQQIKQQLAQADRRPDRFTRLVMLGNAGTHFWDGLTRFGMEGSDPLDRYSLQLTHQFIDSISAEDDENLMLYPQTDFNLPLQQLGQMAGWGEPSPIGNSIHPTYGLWFAFRAAFLTSVPLPAYTAEVKPSPCLTCVDKPCQTACPAAAVTQSSSTFKLNECITHRLKSRSSCAQSCIARMACPVGVEHRYPPAAIHYLYGASLTSIAKWQKQAKHGD